MKQGRPDAAQESGEAMLTVEALTHRYGGVQALDQVSFSLDRGATALVGVNGAGKSTLLGAISGALRPASGRIAIHGHDPYGRDRKAALRAVALMPQSVTFPRRMTAQEVVAYLAWMRGLPSGRARRRAAEALERVGLGARAGSRVGELSGGMLRRVALAQALACDAEVILLDEPSTGLDPEQRRTMVDLVAAVKGTVLMSSHILEDVVDVAGRVLVLDAGRIVFDGTVEELKAVAPDGTDPAKAAETGFLRLISTRQANRS